VPKREDLKSILVIGAGPIVIGQACEFDYSGTQACRALKEEGYRVVLVNSNPATIMTDIEFADSTYIEPITPEYVQKIIEKEKPDALLPTMGGQTALNTAVSLAESGVLERNGVELIGAKLRAITLGGTGGGFAESKSDYYDVVRRGIAESPIGEVLVEECLIGWKEFELEVIRDLADNVIIVCSIENVDPMGVHTGDSITVAPAQTLSDRQYQLLRDASIRIIREIGVETGGSNIQFAINPEDGRIVVIEMNPRVSRSSALASKATGFPIAKVAAKLAVGYRLDEIQNDITKSTPASFEPVIDYCVVKIPRWDFEKFKNVDSKLGVQMKSVGEVMAFGRNFREALQKSLRGLEIGRAGLGSDGKDIMNVIDMTQQQRTFAKEDLLEKIKVPKADRIFYLRYAFQAGATIEEVHQSTGIDPWFLDNVRQIVDFENELRDIADASSSS